VITVDRQTFRKNSQDDDSYYPYGTRGNDSDGDDSIGDARRSDADISSNVELLQRRGRDYDGSMRPHITAPQYHLTPTEEEESEHRQSAKGQQLERMQRRRKARLSRQSLGVSTADTVPGFRGEASLEELISYIDAPALTTGNDKASKKSKKKKKKVSTADSSDASAQKLANSCEVFVGTSGVSSDEPSVRVGDSCCIELTKKSDCDSLPDTTSSPVDTDIYSPEIHDAVDSGDAGMNVLSNSFVTDGSVHPDDDESSPTNTESSQLNIKLGEDLPEVSYAEMKPAVLEEDNVSGNFTESVAATPMGSQSLVVDCKSGAGFLDGNNDGNQIATDMDGLSVESSEMTKMTDSACSLTTENSWENVAEVLPSSVDRQHELDSILPLLVVSDSVTSNTGSVEDLFVTVQKKKRTKNTAVTAEDVRQRFGRRGSAKNVEDRDGSYYVKRSWVKSSDTTSVVPSFSVSRSNIVYSKSSCPMTQRSGVPAAQYSQASSNQDAILSSTVAGKCQNRSALSALPVETEFAGVALQHGNDEPVVKESECESPGGNAFTDATCRSDENKRCEFIMPVNGALSADGVNITHWQASGQKTLVCECNNKTDSCTSSAVSMGMGGAASCVGNDEPSASVDLAPDVYNECSVLTDIHRVSVSSSQDVTSSTCEAQPFEVTSNERKAKSSQLSVQNISTSHVFLDTRNVAGTTPPRSDILFGFDPSTSPEPEPMDVSVSQPVNPPCATFNAMSASCQCPVVAPAVPPPVAGCPPVLYLYPAMPMTILPPAVTFTTGRCTPVGVVPPMPAVADMSNIPVAMTTWQSADDKVISAPVPQDGQDTADEDDALASDAAAPLTSNKLPNEFVLYAAQRYLYSGKLLLCYHS